MTKRFTILLFFACAFTGAFAQFPRFSMATDLGIQRSFKQEQRYWVLGQTVHAIFHIAPKEAVYTWFSYFTNGNFKNSLAATAKSPVTNPQQIAYTNRAKMRLKQFSLGYRKYLRGAADIEKGWSLYAYGGFGIILGRIENTHSTSIDTTIYNVPVYSGKANFKRLTFDLGLGWEMPIGVDFYFYSEGRLWIPTTDYPSRYIFVNNNAPFVAMLTAGLRILF